MLRGCTHLVTGIEWVPSHGKFPDWTPQTSLVIAVQVRRLNFLADENAVHHAERHAQAMGLEDFDARRQAARAWSQRCLQRLVCGHRAWLASHEATQPLLNKWHEDFDPS